MATLPVEQVTQRNRIGIVAITDGRDDSDTGENLWVTTTTLPDTVVLTKAVANDQKDRDELDERVMAGYYDEQDISHLGGVVPEEEEPE